jgi:plasmid maintenance system antidote protein VapI
LAEVTKEHILVVIFINADQRLAGRSAEDIGELFDCADEKWLNFVVEVELERHLKEALARHGLCVPNFLV